MKIRPCKIRRQPKWAILAMVIAAMAWAATAPMVKADENTDKPASGPIRITADTLVTDNTKKTAKFSGKVKATQGDTVLTSDHLTLFYGSQKSPSPSGSTTNIERMEADGNVRIEFDNKVAVSNQAVYIVSERKLVLSGPGSKVISGKDEISGSKITFFRDNGHVALEGDDKNRVNAIIHSDQRGLN